MPGCLKESEPNMIDNMLFMAIISPIIVSIFTWAVFRSGYKTGWKKGFITGRDIGMENGYPIDGNESK